MPAKGTKGILSLVGTNVNDVKAFIKSNKISSRKPTDENLKVLISYCDAKID